MHPLKSAALRAFAASGLTALLRPLHRDAGVVFMLHRFRDPSTGATGHDAMHVRRLLTYLQANDYPVVSLRALLDGLTRGGAPLRGAIAFTIDDGYADQATIAAPLFAEFDYPVTTFVATGFLDGALWFWWDQIAYVLRHASDPTLTLDTPTGPVRYDLTGPGRSRALDEITESCRRMPEDARIELIRRLAAAAAVPLPDRPPPEYAPMTWDQARACENRGMTFGPHTVTHPILATVGGVRAETEIRASWARVKAELKAPVPLFAYPNGKTGDWSEREHRTLQREGLRAVTAEPGFVTPQRYGETDGRLLIPRFAFPDSYEDFVQIVGGLERLKMRVRGQAS